MDWVIPSGGRKRQVEWGVAAQDYAPGYAGRYQNIPLLRRIRRGDWIVAGRACHFAGYGKAVSNFYQGGRSPKIQRRGEYGELSEYRFRERVDVKWHVVPGYESYETWLDLHDFKRELLKAQMKAGGSSSYSPIDFPVGRCLKEIDAGLFKELRRRLDEAGAGPIHGTRGGVCPKSRTVPATSWDELLDEEPSPARKSTVTVTRPVRDPGKRLAAKERANWSCEVPACRIPKFKQRGTGKPYVEAHHLDPLGARGAEHLSNIAVVCAWHHALSTHGPEKDAKKIAAQLTDVRRAKR